MIEIRPAAQRGRSHFDWLDSRHTFSFGDYHHPRHAGFRSLRVLNDDHVEPACGFDRHPHRDMEIVSLVLEGALQHEDSLGSGGTIRPGEVQRMSAGTGIIHSEWNPSQTDKVHFLQIWFTPRMKSRAPGYEQRALPATRNAFHLVASGTAEADAVAIDADADLWRACLDAGAEVSLPLQRGGQAWFHVARGTVELAGLSGRPMIEGDGAKFTDVGEVRVTATTDAEILVFDLG